MTRAAVRLLLLLYPRDWRSRYAAEVEALAEESGFSWRDLADLARRGGVERMRQWSTTPRTSSRPGSFLIRDVMTQDIRFAIRMIRSHPWFSAAIVATLALGIGVNTTVFTLVNAVLFKPLPFRGGDRIVAVRNHNPAKGQDGFPVSYADYREFREQSRAFESLEAVRNEGAMLGEQGNPPEQYGMARITPGLFDMLGVQPILGRSLSAADAEPGAVPVLLISHTVWRNRYASSPEVIGRTVRLNQNPATIIGVMPEKFGFPDAQALWTPLIPTPEQLTNRNERAVLMVGVRKPGVSMEDAAADLGAIAQRIAAQYPDSNKDVGVRVMTFHQLQNDGPIRLIFLLMLGAVGFVLLIACANVANMMLSRALSRTREISVRAAMGASRWRIIRQLLVESTLLSFLGGALGLLLARFGVNAFDLAVADVGKPSWILFTPDYLVFVYFAVLCLASGILFGLAPGLRASRVDLNEALKDGTRTAGSTRGGFLSGALVVFQFTLAVVLLAGAGLFIRSFLAQQASVANLPLNRILQARFNLPEYRYKDNDARMRFYDQLLDRVQGIPGVRQTALVSNPPATGGPSVQFQIEGEPDAEPAQRRTSLLLSASPSYFEVIGLPILAGRTFEQRDGLPGYGAAVVTAAFAARNWPKESPLGKRFRVFGATASDVSQWLTVVGVSADVQQQLAERREEYPFFLPYRPGRAASMTVLIRGDADATSYTPALRSAVQELDSDLALNQVMTLSARMYQQLWYLRVFGSLFTVFAGAALLMASVGIYAVVAHSTGRRTQEIGIRMALGATSLTVLRLVLGRGLKQLAAGLVLGLVASFGATRLMSNLLTNISPADPIVFGSVTVVLVGVGLLACWLPARRAAALAPTKALRHE